MTAVDVVVPEGIDDPSRPSGGNRYDRCVCDGLRAAGWTVREHAVGAPAALERVLRDTPAGGVVMLDGLVTSTAPDVVAAQAGRLRLVALVHMPLGDAAERAVVSAAAAVVTTSRWSHRRLVELHALAPDRVHVAEPGVEPAPLAPGSAAGTELLCVAAVLAAKGHDVLVDALSRIAALPWRCTCVGSLERDPEFARRVAHERIAFPGPRTGAELDRCYATADLLVLASRAEAYGMVVTEALARGLPVVATDVGGVPEALGRTGAGVRPGLLVAPGDPVALAEALRAWLTDAQLRAHLRAAAVERRAALRPWSATTAEVARVLGAVA